MPRVCQRLRLHRLWTSFTLLHIGGEIAIVREPNPDELDSPMEGLTALKPATTDPTACRSDQTGAAPFSGLSPVPTGAERWYTCWKNCPAT
jgi:hypothetical protein